MSYTEESDRDMGKNASRSTSPTIAEGDRTVTVVETGEKRREESEETEETRSNYRPAVVTEFVLGLKILNFFPIKRYIMVSSSSLKVVPITSMHSHWHKLKLKAQAKIPESYPAGSDSDIHLKTKSSDFRGLLSVGGSFYRYMVT